MGRPLKKEKDFKPEAWGEEVEVRYISGRSSVQKEFVGILKTYDERLLLSPMRMRIQTRHLSGSDIALIRLAFEF